MASNEIPRNYDPLVEQLEDAADGAALLGATIPLKQNDEAAIRADLENLAGKAAGPGGVPPAVKGKRTLWNEAKEARTNLRAAERSANSNGRAVLAACVSVLKPRLGQSWNNAWQAAGFTNNSIAIPARPSAMLGQMRAYLETNPTHEVAALGATAAACESAAQAISEAQQELNAGEANATTAKENYEAAMATARARMSNLVAELSLLLKPEDPRWYNFGLERPSDPDTPEVVTDVVATPLAAGSRALFIDWPNARRVDSYRLILRQPGGEVIAEEIVQDSERTVHNLPANGPVSISVTARNTKGGESAPSTPVTAAVP